MGIFDSVVDLPSRTWGFWSSVLTGDGIPIRQDPAVFETEPYAVGRYDVAQVVMAYQKAWIGTKPNHVTPIDLLDLLLFLDEFTAQIEAEDHKRRRQANGELAPCDSAFFDSANPGYRQSCVDLERWRRRLDEYLAFVSAVPVEQENDRRVVLWDVTAPLFVGWYGGLTGTEIPLDPQAFPPGFDPMRRHPADIATPYSLANQFGVWVAWQDERKQRLIHDLTPPKPNAFDWTLLLAVGAVALGGYALLSRN